MCVKFAKQYSDNAALSTTCASVRADLFFIWSESCLIQGRHIPATVRSKWRAEKRHFIYIWFFYFFFFTLLFVHTSSYRRRCLRPFSTGTHTPGACQSIAKRATTAQGGHDQCDRHDNGDDNTTHGEYFRDRDKSPRC